MAQQGADLAALQQQLSTISDDRAQETARQAAFLAAQTEQLTARDQQIKLLEAACLREVLDFSPKSRALPHQGRPRLPTPGSYSWSCLPPRCGIQDLQKKVDDLTFRMCRDRDRHSLTLAHLCQKYEHMSRRNYITEFHLRKACTVLGWDEPALLIPSPTDAIPPPPSSNPGNLHDDVKRFAALLRSSEQTSRHESAEKRDRDKELRTLRQLVTPWGASPAPFVASTSPAALLVPAPTAPSRALADTQVEHRIAHLKLTYKQLQNTYISHISNYVSPLSPPSPTTSSRKPSYVITSQQLADMTPTIASLQCSFTGERAAQPDPAETCLSPPSSPPPASSLPCRRMARGAPGHSGKKGDLIATALPLPREIYYPTGIRHVVRWCS